MSEQKEKVTRDCEQVVRALWDYLDAELDDGTLADIETHLRACAPCRAHADFEQRLLEEIARLRREHTDIEALKQRIEAALARAKAEG